ncbi:MAG: hypothetical protein IJA29_07955 [Lachnospiraceae bacterium]|nr:hypothetical protein [Lachnospiraceae bacterium]
MKNSKLILIIAAMAGMLAFTGCNAEITLQDSTGEEMSTIVIETSTEENMETNEVTNTETVVTNTTGNSAGNGQEDFTEEVTDGTDYVAQTDAVADVFTEADENWNYVLTQDEEFAYLFEVKYDETTAKEYATIICQGENGENWTYETDKYDIGQCCALEILESPVNVIYLNEGGTITALNIYDGKVLWQNSEYQGSGTVCTMDEQDNLYVAGFDSPSLMIIDPNGQTLLRVPQFAEYFWPYEMSIEDNMLTILFDSEENAKVVMDIRDYSYNIY